MGKQDDNQKGEEIKKEPEEKTSEYKEKYLRALADYQNLERQTQNWKEDFVQYANSSLIKKLLEILDDLEKAQEHLKDEGLQLIANKLNNILEGEGVEELKLEGQEFNPEFGEVVSTQPGEKDNIVTKVLQKGYQLKDKIIRPAKVVVSTKQTVDDGK